jgi:hypothetical protein
MFELTFPRSSWDENKASILSACRKYGRNRFYHFCIEAKEKIARGKWIENPIGYVVGRMKDGSGLGE